MPKTILHLLSDEAQEQRRVEWAEAVTDEWLKPRTADTSEHISKKGFTREDLVQLADLAVIADDIRISELRANAMRLPGPGTWTPDPESAMWIIIRALYKEFGYIVGFLAHVRERATPGFGFKGKHFKSFGSRNGLPRENMTPTVVDRFMRNPFFVEEVKRRTMGKNLSPGWKDVIGLIEEFGPFKATKSLFDEVSRR